MGLDCVKSREVDNKNLANVPLLSICLKTMFSRVHVASSTPLLGLFANYISYGVQQQMNSAVVLLLLISMFQSIMLFLLIFQWWMVFFLFFFLILGTMLEISVSLMLINKQNESLIQFWHIVVVKMMIFHSVWCIGLWIGKNTICNMMQGLQPNILNTFWILSTDTETILANLSHWQRISGWDFSRSRWKMYRMAPKLYSAVTDSFHRFPVYCRMDLELLLITY